MFKKLPDDLVNAMFEDEEQSLINARLARHNAGANQEPTPMDIHEPVVIPASLPPPTPMDEIPGPVVVYGRLHSKYRTPAPALPLLPRNKSLKRIFLQYMKKSTLLKMRGSCK